MCVGRTTHIYLYVQTDSAEVGVCRLYAEGFSVAIPTCGKIKFPTEFQSKDCEEKRAQ